MKLTEIDLNLLVAFEALFAERSVTRAARRIGVAQPSMSDALARLRLLFADALFVRAAGEMRPTPKALQIAPGVSVALDGLRQTLDAGVTFDPGAAQRTFTVASTDYTSLVILPHLLAKLRLEAPHVDLRVIGYEKSSVGELLDRGEADVALGVFQVPPERTIRTVLFQERFVGLVRRAHPALQDGRMDLEAFVGWPHALVTVRDRDARGALDEALGKHGLKRRIALTLPHMLALPGILGSSDLVAAMPERVARSLRGDGLRTFAIPVEVPEWQVEMLWNPTARNDQAGQWFRALARGVAQLA